MKKFCDKLKENFFLYSSNDQIPTKNDLIYQVNSDDLQKENKKKSCCQKFKIFSCIKTNVLKIIFCVCLKKRFLNFSNQKTPSFILDIAPDKKSKKTLILDLDETLVHSEFFECKCDFKVEVFYQGSNIIFYVNVRPGAQKFIEIMSEFYEIIIFTASLSEVINNRNLYKIYNKYAEKVIDILDNNNKVSHRLYRENCVANFRGMVKDLTRLNRDLKNIILIDNSTNSFSFQPDNGLHILPYLNDKKDNELYKLVPFLQHMSNINDVRSVSALKKKFDEEFSNFNLKKLSFQTFKKEDTIFSVENINFEKLTDKASENKINSIEEENKYNSEEKSNFKGHKKNNTKLSIDDIEKQETNNSERIILNKNDKEIDNISPQKKKNLKFIKIDANK